MSSTLPGPHHRAATAAGFVPDPYYEKEQRRRFLFYPLTPDATTDTLERATSSYPSGWRVTLLDTMRP
jgi:hypothetical protein